MKVQQITISDYSDSTVMAEIQISEAQDIDDSEQYVLARVRLPKPSTRSAFVHVQLHAVKELQSLAAQAIIQIEQQLQ